MMQNNPELQQKLKQKLATNLSIGSDIGKIFAYLPSCEYNLISYMNQQGLWPGSMPPVPNNYEEEASVEFGLILYWLNNPSLITNTDLSVAVDIIMWLLGELKIAPSTQMTSAGYNNLNVTSNPLIYSDGSVLSTETYATFDQGWLAAFINFIVTIFNGLYYNSGTLPLTPAPTPINLRGARPNQVTIALVGDWGTGNATANSVMRQITALNPDYIVHLGDVYYGGTPTTTPAGSDLGYIDLGEETANLLANWPPAYAGKSFTLNSNHEMYSGANGLFLEALNAQATPPGSGSPFSAQNGQSCFALRYGGWNILGLDTAYYADIFNIYMTGNIWDTQASWISGLNGNAAQTIVMSHHTGFAYDCSSKYGVWDQLNSALGGDPYAWYWGHVHNGIVYNSPLTIGSFTTNTFARCLGHGALPYGAVQNLDGNTNIAWKESSRMSQSSRQLYNGFATLTLTLNTSGQMSSITENFYDLSSTTPVWTKTIFEAATS